MLAFSPHKGELSRLAIDMTAGNTAGTADFNDVGIATWS
jgi:hypothetical protein